MARPRKTGLDYYPKDVGTWDDIKIMKLVNEYGPMGYCVYDIIRDEVYRSGYYLEVSPDNIAWLIIRKIGNRWINDMEFVKEIIHFCGETGLFDKEMLEQSVITSVGIQRRYAEVTARNKVCKDKYWLLDEQAPRTPMESAAANTASQEETEGSVKNDTHTATDNAVKTVYSPETEVYAAETPVSAANIPQSKLKKSKVNESKVNESKVCASGALRKNYSSCIHKDHSGMNTHTYVSSSQKWLCVGLVSPPGSVGASQPLAERSPPETRTPTPQTPINELISVSLVLVPSQPGQGGKSHGCICEEWYVLYIFYRKNVKDCRKKIITLENSVALLYNMIVRVTDTI